MEAGNLNHSCDNALNWIKCYDANEAVKSETDSDLVNKRIDSDTDGRGKNGTLRLGTYVKKNPFVRLIKQMLITFLFNALH